MTGPRWTAVGFDLDGTLVDSRPGIEWAAREAALVAAPGHDLVGFADHIGARVPALFERCLPQAGPEVVVEVGRAFRRLYDDEGWRRCTVYPGVVDLLDALVAAGTTCHVVTNKPSTPTAAILALHGLDRWVSSAVSPDSPPTHPDKDAALAWLVGQRAWVPAEVLFVGDTVEDLEAATHSGTSFIGAAYGYGGAGLRQVPGALLCGDSTQLAALVFGEASPTGADTANLSG
ncbi:MAG: HAD family hydrolase [Mycobacteriales bacterium]|nr:HAD family hydrolase [Mycobacteriales bacterium]